MLLKENEQLEFKKTTSELNEAMVSICSILNKHGKGTLYFGLKNDGTPFKFTINDSTLRDVSRKIFESIKPQIYPIIKTDHIDNIEVIKVSFEGKDKPYSAFGKYYKRVADEDREMAPNELRKMMIAQEYEENWENMSSSETIEDIDRATFDKFNDDARTCGRLPDYGRNPNIIIGKLGLLNGNKLTNAGRMLFSKNKPITLKMAVFATEHKATFLDISKVEGNIFELIDSAINYIVSNIRWKSELSEDGIHRIETPEVPIDVIREAVINSFAHARYDLKLQHEIGIYSNRVSITNPGSFANEYRPEDFATRDLHSFLRNEAIAKILYLCKDVETFGSGLRKIYTLCDLSSISINYINENNYFTIEFSRIDRNIMSDSDTINDTINGTITDLEHNILKEMKSNKNITVKELSVVTNKSIRSINRAILSLKNKKIIERVGPNKTGYWKTLI